MDKKRNKKIKEVERRRREAKKERQQRRLQRAQTQNGKKIVQLMEAEKIRGNYKDYVILVGDQLIDWQKTMNLRTEDAPVRVDKPHLVHKKKLKNIINPEAARAFWHPVVGRLVDVPPATKPKGKRGHYVARKMD